jgi:hypothetical protein
MLEESISPIAGERRKESREVRKEGEGGGRRRSKKNERSSLFVL